MSEHLVTGGSGFLGNLIISRLLERGHKVTNLDIWKDPNQHPDVKFIEADIRDKKSVSAAMKGIEVVHNNVALVPLTKSGKDFWSVNVDGARISAECAKENGISKFVHMSSSAIYGKPQEFPITNYTKTNPCEIYGRGKLAGENEVRRVLGDSNVQFSIIRPRTILGNGRLGIFQILFKWIEANKNIYTIGQGNELFQFIHAHDLMDAYMLTLDQEGNGEYNVGTTDYGTLREALKNLITYANSKSMVKSLPVIPTIASLTALDYLKLSPLAPWHYKTFHKPFYFDMTPLTKMGWQSKYSNDRMLQESYDSFLSRDKGENGVKLSPHRSEIDEKILRVIRKLS